MSKQNGKHRHAIVGEAPSEPKVKAPTVSREVKGITTPSRPHGEGGRNVEHSPSRKTISPPSRKSREEKFRIPLSGRVEDQIGHPYPRMEPEELEVHENSGAAKRCIQAQIKTSTPTAEMVEESEE